MRQIRSHRVRAVSVAALALALAAVPVSVLPASAASPLGQNLVVNPGAEAGAGTSGYTVVAIPGWTTSPNFTVVRYGAPEFPTKGESTRIGGGAKFFSCGPDTAFATASQYIAIKGRAGPIDAGLIRVKVKVRQAGYSGGLDQARVVLIFIDAQGSGIGQLATTGTTGTFGLFRLKKASSVLPEGTRRILVTLEGDRADDGGSYCDAYFDKVSVVLGVVD